MLDNIYKILNSKKEIWNMQYMFFHAFSWFEVNRKILNSFGVWAKSEVNVI